MAKQICTSCGFEGRGKHAGKRSGGTTARILGMLLMLPIYTLWKAMGRNGKVCPHCGMPTMVKMRSNAGKLTRHMIDVELGILKVAKPEERKQVETFGNDRPARPATKKPVDPEQW